MCKDYGRHTYAVLLRVHRRAYPDIEVYAPLRRRNQLLLAHGSTLVGLDNVKLCMRWAFSHFKFDHKLLGLLMVTANDA